MRILLRSDYAEMSQTAANLVAEQIRRKPHSVIAWPTGGTPRGMYANLVQRYRRGDIDFSQVISFNLDEYQIPRDHPQSYSSFMQQELFSKVNADPNNIHIPDGMTPNPEAHCRAYENQIREAGGIDLLILGIGTNGHVCFNEPTSSFASRTRKTVSCQSSRRHFVCS